MVLFDQDDRQAPDQVVYCLVGGGTPTLNERTFDCHQVQLRYRGPQNDSATAENFTAVIDDLIMGSVCPVTIGGRRVIDLDYAGGPPQFLAYDTSRRTQYVGRYLVTIAREVF
jgi:hypothetical protein